MINFVKFFLFLLTNLMKIDANNFTETSKLDASRDCLPINSTRTECCYQTFETNSVPCIDSLCQPNCLNGGQCVYRNLCLCPSGFSGSRCELDIRTGYCYKNFKRSFCFNPIENVKCTKQICCSTLGEAWGHPCEKCPNNFDCPKGFLKNHKTGECQDIDECKMIPNLCYGGNCLNTAGSFRCECEPGYEMSQLTNRCEDINECLSDNKCLNGKCFNTPKSFYCLCNPGFIQAPNRQFCVDGRQGYCYTNRSDIGNCSNRMPLRLSQKDCCCGRNMGQGWGNLKSCQKCPTINENDYNSLCLEILPGLILNQKIEHKNETKTISNSIDVNECSLRPDVCGNGTCIDTKNGYECRCHNGFELDTFGQICQDIDECNDGYCQGGRCLNTNGGFECLCPKGFDLSTNKRMCTDRNECSTNGMCTNGICINTNGGFKCHCKSGFKLGSQHDSCIDIDECAENPRICLNGRCINEIGSYSCSCHLGFIEASDKSFCIDVNECAAKDFCTNGKCINTEGSFRCICDSGYSLIASNSSCVDVDECGRSPCTNGRCRNTDGSFFCECPSGFTLNENGRVCIDSKKDLCYQKFENQLCLNPIGVPVTKSSCCCGLKFNRTQSNSWGSIDCELCPLKGSLEYETLCPYGAGRNFNGDDINECSLNPNICVNGACENLRESFRCHCDPGYQLDTDRNECTDINECATDPNYCFNGQCRNTIGSFYCICPSGTKFNQKSKICEDINECEDYANVCLNAKCINLFGSYKCYCDHGFALDPARNICVDNKKGPCWKQSTENSCENNLVQKITQNECCCSRFGVAWGSPCQNCSYTNCNCPAGYLKQDGLTCTDINECYLFPDICDQGGVCINTDGSYHCQCRSGFIADESKKKCIDNRENVCYTKRKFDQCSSPVNGFYKKNVCCCSPVGKSWGSSNCEQCPSADSSEFRALCPNGLGFTHDQDINECVHFTDICKNGGCSNSNGSFECVCNPGYALDEIGFQCVDIDECSITIDACGNGTCVNAPGQFYCKCNPGFRSRTALETCNDINECEEDENLCFGGTCVNTDGSYYCECPDGHELTSDRKSCKDIDECSRTSGICSNGFCVNLLGTYQCICDDGFQQKNNRLHCEDIDECQDDNGNCDDMCTNTFGSYLCSCGDGYELQSDGRTCTDIDECSRNSRICNGGRCANKLGGYSCDCFNGLVLNANGSKCVDINECLLDENLCGYGECENKFGYYECNCLEGFSVKVVADGGGDGLTEIADGTKELAKCSDENECELGLDNCDPNANCTNTLGSFKCTCHNGYIGNGIVCEDNNECISNNRNCDSHAKCINTLGSFRCECDKGYFGDGKICDDIDECMQDGNLCENGHCINVAGGYRCECEMGFEIRENTTTTMTATASSCSDINECERFHNLCLNGRCENLIGMFRCDCNEGYKLDDSGANCTDINECDIPLLCLYGECTNYDGYYECKCSENYDLVESRNACVDRRTSRCYLEVDNNDRCFKGFSDYATRASCCCSIGVAWGPLCERCPVKGSNEYDELCPGGTGYKPNLTTAVLEDIHECDEFEQVCKHGRCTNTFGSFVCSCNQGYYLDESKSMCLDIDECKENSLVCNEGYCINEPGSFRCNCPVGYMTTSDRKQCIDMRKDMCYLELADDDKCTAAMSQIQTRKLCCCSMGKAWGRSCIACPLHGTVEFVELCGPERGQIFNLITNQTEEIDECYLMPRLCTNGICLNTPGSFFCECNRGFVYDHTSHECIDSNECLESEPCHNNAECVNTIGSFECKCPHGYKLDLSGRSCHDIDECLESQNVCTNGICKNLLGSYQCVCNSGFYLSAERNLCLDIDECLRFSDICKFNATCMNTFGSYKCFCATGFHLNEFNECEDIDECFSPQSLACKHGKCRNTIGSFTCQCSDGYVLSVDGAYCRDIDECFEVPGACPLPGKCENIPGSYLCTCPKNYFLNTTGNICMDIDECEENKRLCQNGECLNTNGSYYCRCYDGHHFDEIEQICIDRRENVCYNQAVWRQCSMPRIVNLTREECCCSRGAGWGDDCDRCPIEGSRDFSELCPNGYGYRNSGEDIDECSVNNMCSNSKCVNTDGSFRCECDDGFRFDAVQSICIDVDECASGENVCGNGTCINTKGSFRCECNRGFQVNSHSICEDVNECLEFGYQCAFQCINTLGSFKCSCPFGYQLAADQRHCTDIDECKTLDHKCPYGCRNLLGSYKCECPAGYKELARDANDDRSGTNCIDINECLADRQLCRNGRCSNLNGTFECICSDGYQQSADKKQCLDNRLGYCFDNEKCSLASSSENFNSVKVNKIDCCCSLGVAWGLNFCQLCPNKYSNDFYQLCLQNQSNSLKIDIDECVLMSNLCQNGKCINTMGSYRCVCNKGFEIDRSGTICKDINECQKLNQCQFYCKNTIGGYECVCPSGYRLSSDRRTCTDIDECGLGEHMCQQVCVNTNGSYVCSCQRGYRQNGDFCTDIDECHTNNECLHPAKCLNTIGSFKCVCPRGLKIDRSGRFCLPSRTLSNCSHGFEYDSDSKRCHDIDECLQANACGSNAVACRNYDGGFRCDCSTGFVFDSKRKICVPAASSTDCLNGQSCLFGCGSSGSGCTCPFGYGNIASVHCLTTIEPFDNSPKIVSTEGCYSCQINGRKRRNLNNGNFSTDQFNYFRQRKNSLHLKLEQTKRKNSIIKFFPAIKDNVKYWLKQGFERKIFQLKNKNGIWSINFRKRLRKANVFHLTLHGDIRTSNDGYNDHTTRHYRSRYNHNNHNRYNNVTLFFPITIIVEEN